MIGNTYTQFKGGNPFASQAKMLFHSDRIWDYLQTGDLLPVFCEVNLTNRCNLRCLWCISENFRANQSTIHVDALARFVVDFAAAGGKAITFSGGGEPTQHPEFSQCVRLCREANLELGLMTNGAYDPDLNNTIAENAQWVRISLDTTDPSHYRQWKGIDRLDLVLKNLRSLTKYSSVKVGVNCNVYRNLTIREVDDLINLLDEYNLAYLQFRPIIPRYFKSETADLNNRVWSYLSTVQDPRINYSYDKYVDLATGVAFPFQSCEAHRASFVVDSDGNLCPCMYHPDDSRFVFGSLYNSSFLEIWRSQQRQDVIRFMQQELNMPRECQVCCKLCELNKLFDFLKNGRLDANFL